MPKAKEKIVVKKEVNPFEGKTIGKVLISTVKKVNGLNEVWDANGTCYLISDEELDKVK